MEDSKREELMQLALVIEHEVARICGAGTDVVMLVHPAHAKNEPCSGSVMLTSADANATESILGHGVKFIHRLKSGEIKPATTRMH